MDFSKYARDKDGYMKIVLIDSPKKKKQKKQYKPALTILPVEIIMNEIFKYLQYEDLINIGYTCPKFRLFVEKFMNIKIFRLKSGYFLAKHQLRVIKWMTLRSKKDDRTGICGGIVGMKMGLGKTLTSIMYSLMNYNGSPTLVLTDKSIIEEWENTFNKFFYKKSGIKVIYLHRDYLGDKKINNLPKKKILESHFVITTYETLTSVCKEYNFDTKAFEYDSAERKIGTKKVLRPYKVKTDTGKKCLYTIKWKRIIADEGQKMNNTSTSVYKAMLNLCCEESFVLSGTFVRNDVLDLLSLFRFLGYSSENMTRDYFKNLIIQENLMKFIISIDYKDTDIKLKPLNIVEKLVYLDEEEQNIYNYILDQTRDEMRKLTFKKITYASVLAKFTLLRESCIAPYLIKKSEELDNEEMEDQDEWLEDIDGTSGIKSKKIKALTDIIVNIPKGEKVIVFSMFNKALKLIQYSLEKRGNKNTIIIEGSTNVNERKMQLNKFKSSKTHNVLMMNYKIGSQGLNLTEANHVICIEPWWCPSVEDQAVARCQRNGQTKQVSVYRVSVADTIETKMMKEIREKKMNIEENILTASKKTKLDIDLMARLLDM